jgi:hypothetical protein
VFHLENRVCLSHGVQVEGVAWRAATSIVTRVRDLVQMTGDGRTGRELGSRTIERSGGTVYGLHHAHEDDKCEFFG